MIPETKKKRKPPTKPGRTKPPSGVPNAVYLPGRDNKGGYKRGHSKHVLSDHLVGVPGMPDCVAHWAAYDEEATKEQMWFVEYYKNKVVAAIRQRKLDMDIMSVGDPRKVEETRWGRIVLQPAVKVPTSKWTAGS